MVTKVRTVFSPQEYNKYDNIDEDYLNMIA